MRTSLIFLAMLSASAALAQEDPNYGREAPLSSPSAENYRENREGIPRVTFDLPEQSSPRQHSPGYRGIGEKDPNDNY